MDGTQGMLLVIAVILLWHLGHVGADNPGVLAVGIRTLPDLGEGDSLHHFGGTKNPKDAEHGLPAGVPDVEEDEASQPNDAAGTLDGARVPAHADLVHLLAEELHEEHPCQDQPSS